MESSGARRLFAANFLGQAGINQAAERRPVVAEGAAGCPPVLPAPSAVLFGAPAVPGSPSCPAKLPYCGHKNNKVPADPFLQSNLEPGVSVAGSGGKRANVIYKCDSSTAVGREDCGSRESGREGGRQPELAGPWRAAGGLRGSGAAQVGLRQVKHIPTPATHRWTTEQRLLLPCKAVPFAAAHGPALAVPLPPRWPPPRTGLPTRPSGSRLPPQAPLTFRRQGPRKGGQQQLG